VPFSLDLPKDVDSIVIAKSSAHLIIVHRQMVLLDSPKTCQSRWVDYLKDARLYVLPRYKTAVSLTWVIQQLLQKVPQ